jgi:hypothetical protein
VKFSAPLRYLAKIIDGKSDLSPGVPN